MVKTIVTIFKRGPRRHSVVKYLVVAESCIKYDTMNVRYTNGFAAMRLK